MDSLCFALVQCVRQAAHPSIPAAPLLRTPYSICSSCPCKVLLYSVPYVLGRRRGQVGGSVFPCPEATGRWWNDWGRSTEESEKTRQCAGGPPPKVNAQLIRRICIDCGRSLRDELFEATMRHETEGHAFRSSLLASWPAGLRTPSPDRPCYCPISSTEYYSNPKTE